MRIRWGAVEAVDAMAPDFERIKTGEFARDRRLEANTIRGGGDEFAVDDG